MAKSPPPLLHYLPRLSSSRADDLTDAELLDRFRKSGEEAAFTLLVQRHGSAVRGVCRRVLGHAADADDAFQATFLVLLRKAGSVRRAGSLGCWLYGVAYRVATRARSRRRPTVPLRDDHGPAAVGPAEQAARRELAAVLDEEICGLPEEYRAPFVLCVLGQATYEQAARELCSSKSAVARRLDRAQDLLRLKLTRRGVGVTGALLSAVLTHEARAAAVPALLTLETVRLVRQAAAGRPPSVAAEHLAEHVVRHAVSTRRLAVLSLGAALGLMAAATGLLGGRKEAPPETATAPRREVASGRSDAEGVPLPAEALARVGSARLRHGRQGPHLEYSPDGTLLVSSGGGRVRMWEARTGRLVWQRTPPGVGRIPDGFFAADGKSVVVLDGQTCRWFDARDGQEVRACDVKFPERTSGACLGPQGVAIAVADITRGGELVVYDLPSGNVRFRRKPEGRWLGQLAFSPDGKTLIAREEGWPPLLAVSARVLNAETGRPLGELHPREPDGLTFAPDGKAVLSHDRGMRLCVTGVPGDERLQWLQTPVYGLLAAAYAPDGKSVVLGGLYPDAVRIDLATGKELQRFHTRADSSGFAFAPDGKTLAVAAGGGIITQWDLAGGKRLAASADPADDYWSPRFEAGGTLLSAGSDELVTLDWRTGRVVRRVPLPREGSPRCTGLSPDRSRVAGFNAAALLTVWDAASGKELFVLPKPLNFAGRPAFSPDGSTLYTGEADGPVRAWGVATGKEMPAFDKEQRLTRALVVSPDGRWLAAADHPQVPSPRREVVVWDLAGGRVSRRLLPPGEGRARDLAFSPDGSALAAVGGAIPGPNGAKDGFVALWDVRGGGERFARSGLSDDLISLAFAEDGRSLATGSEDGTLRLWETASGRQRHRFAGHASGVHAVAFAADGKLLASASADDPLFVWDVDGGFDKPASESPFSAEERAGLWDGLRQPDAAEAFGAMRRLLARPGPAVGLLRERLPPAPVPEENALGDLLARLDAESYDVREKATADLEAVAELAAPFLRKALQGKLTPEAKRRVERALESAGLAAPARLRELRAVEVAEHIGTARARELLSAWAGGAEEALLTREARAAVERLKRR
jgi:RNA polymerase sigma factor (sigma-70 family)